MRVDLGLPAGVGLHRRMTGGPDCEFAVSKRDVSGALVTIFITLDPPPTHVIRRVLPLAGGDN
jgi:hypothetical protein